MPRSPAKNKAMAQRLRTFGAPALSLCPAAAAAPILPGPRSTAWEQREPPQHSERLAEECRDPEPSLCNKAVVLAAQ